MDKKKEENIKLDFLHICEYASLGNAGKLNILNIFENINLTKTPKKYPQFFIVTKISSTRKSDFEEIIRIVDEEDNDIIVPLKFSFSPSKNNKKNSEENFGVMAQINNTNFPKFGQYKVQVYIGKDLIGQQSLKISQAKKYEQSK